MTKEQIIWAIMKERGRQDLKWGGKEHDQQHTPAQWLEYLITHVQEVLKAIEQDDMETYEKVMIESGALIFAALESRQQ